MTNEEMLQRLKDLGVDEIDVEYFGSGGDASFENAFARNAMSSKIDLPSDLNDALLEAADQFLRKHASMWYDDDGAFGNWVLEVETGKIHLDHNWRVMDSTYEHYEGRLDEAQAAPTALPPASPVCKCPTLINGHHHGCPFKE